MPITISLKLASTSTGAIFSATPRQPFIDTSVTPNATVIETPITTTVAGQTASLSIPASEDQQVSYLFEVYNNLTRSDYYLQTGILYVGPSFLHTDGSYYTGSVYVDANTNKVLTKVDVSYKSYLLSFDAIVPKTPSTNTVENLYKTGITTEQLDHGAWRVADIMSSVPTFKSRFSVGFTPKGQWSESTTYQKDDLVTYGGRLYAQVSSSPSINVIPGTLGANGIWLLQVDKGDPGGTGASLVGYNATSWLASSDAAARGDVRQGIEDLRGSFNAANYAPLVGATFTGNILAPTPSSSELPTSKVVGNIEFLRNNTNRVIFEATLNADTVLGADNIVGGGHTVKFNNVVRNPLNLTYNTTIGELTLPTADWYTFLCIINGKYTGGGNSDLLLNIWLYVNTTLYQITSTRNADQVSANFCHINQYSANDKFSVRANLVSATLVAQSLTANRCRLLVLRGGVWA